MVVLKVRYRNLHFVFEIDRNEAAFYDFDGHFAKCGKYKMMIDANCEVYARLRPEKGEIFGVLEDSLGNKYLADNFPVEPTEYVFRKIRNIYGEGDNK